MVSNFDQCKIFHLLKVENFFDKSKLKVLLDKKSDKGQMMQYVFLS